MKRMGESVKLVQAILKGRYVLSDSVLLHREKKRDCDYVKRQTTFVWYKEKTSLPPFIYLLSVL